jgi:DNA-binding Lrp family transcriptional regulator
MDELDIAIIHRLLADSRTPYSALANGLGISVQATHKRVNTMVRSGVIRRFTARISLRATGVTEGLAFGRSNETDLNKLVARLKTIDQVRGILVSSGNNLHIVLDIKNADDLEPLRTTLRDEAMMADIALVAVPCNASHVKSSDRKGLQLLDLRIIYAMRNNSRLPLTEIAEQVGVTTKTVSKALDRMERDGSVRMSIEWMPDQRNDFLSLVHTRFKEGHQPDFCCSSILSSIPRIVSPLPFSNRPDTMAFLLWSESMADMCESLDHISRLGSVESVVPYVIHHLDYFPTWRDTLLGALVKNKVPLDAVIDRSDPHVQIP